MVYLRIFLPLGALLICESLGAVSYEGDRDTRGHYPAKSVKDAYYEGTPSRSVRDSHYQGNPYYGTKGYDSYRNPNQENNIRRYQDEDFDDGDDEQTPRNYYVNGKRYYQNPLFYRNWVYFHRPYYRTEYTYPNIFPNRYSDNGEDGDTGNYGNSPDENSNEETGIDAEAPNEGEVSTGEQNLHES